MNLAANFANSTFSKELLLCGLETERCLAYWLGGALYITAMRQPGEHENVIPTWSITSLLETIPSLTNLLAFEEHKYNPYTKKWDAGQKWELYLQNRMLTFNTFGEGVCGLMLHAIETKMVTVEEINAKLKAQSK
jgi:hypothetical protein